MNTPDRMAKLGYVYLCRTVPQRIFSMPCLRNFHELAAGQIERLTTGQITAGRGARMASRLSQARLHAKLQYLPAGDRQANSNPATLAGELTRLAAWDLINGRLAKPFDLSLKLSKTYWIVCPKAASTKPKIMTFRDWLLAEAADDTRRLRKMFGSK